MKTLFVCHSVGDTNAAIEVAKELLKNVQNEVFFLAIHPTAEKRLTASMAALDQERVHITSMDELFETSTQAISNSQLNKQVIQYVDAHHIQNALVGTPSQNTETRSFDIAQTLTTYFSNQHVFIYNDYLFEEKAHAYWAILNKDSSSWQKQIHWLVPLPTVHEKITTKNSELTVSNVGHPIIDEALTRETIDTEAVRQALDINDHYSFVYISGSKDPDQDIEFLTALFQGLSTYSSSNIALRLGMHPGLSDKQTYLHQVCALIDKFPTLSAHIKILVPKNDGRTLTEFDEQTLSHHSITDIPKLADQCLSSEQITAAAEGIASVCPATLTSLAILQGKPAYVHDTSKPSFFSSQSIYSGASHLPNFFTALLNQTPKKPLNKADLGLAENQSFAEEVIHHLKQAI
jgi:hypothetical protein